MSLRFSSTVMLGMLASLSALAPAAEPEPVPDAAPAETPLAAADRVAAGLREPLLKELVAEALERSPALAAARSAARAAGQRAPQDRALPDPMVGVTGYVWPPETRVGPQRLMLKLSQGLPWPGKRALRERAARLEATAARAALEAERLSLVTEVRRLAWELAYLDLQEEITTAFHEHLLQHEELARSRYATGVGLGQGVVKLQAEITSIESRLLEIAVQRASLAARLNGLRDRDASAPLPALDLPSVGGHREPHQDFLAGALDARPEVEAADARLARAAELVRLAAKEYRPDFEVGLMYAVVDRRDDEPGRLQPPPDNGQDDFGFQGGISLPLWRRKLAAGVEEARQLEGGAAAERRAVEVEIRSALEDIVARWDLSWRRLRLLEDLLLVQAEESLESAEAGYIAGTLNALDLLDAEHVLFDARIAVARARVDYLVAEAELEGAVGAPLTAETSRGDGA